MKLYVKTTKGTIVFDANITLDSKGEIIIEIKDESKAKYFPKLMMLSFIGEELSNQIEYYIQNIRRE